MKKVYFIVLLCTINSHFLFSQSDTLKRNNVFLEWGNNIWGNTIGIGYKYGLTRHFATALSLSSGKFHYIVGASQKFLWLKGIHGNDNTINIDLDKIIDFKFEYIRKSSRGFIFLNTFALGMSYISLTFRDEFGEDKLPGIWRGQKDISVYALIVSIDLLDYKPAKDMHTSFAFGVKSRFTYLDNPQNLLYENVIIFSVQNGSLRQGHGKYQYWFYPEAYLRVNYSF